MIDPLLGPLADNGGFSLPDGRRILTHALLPGSPAVDAGDPDVDPSAPVTDDAMPYDQRGFPFSRVQHGRIDIGAFEVQETLVADFDENNQVDGADFLAQQRGYGTPALVATKQDGDMDVDELDVAAWEASFGLAEAEVDRAALATEAPLPESDADRSTSAVAVAIDPFAALSITPVDDRAGLRETSWEDGEELPIAGALGAGLPLDQEAGGDFNT